MGDTKPAVRSPEDKQLAEELVERARDEGVELVGPDGLLTGLMKDVLETGLEVDVSAAWRQRGPALRIGVIDIGVEVLPPKDQGKAVFLDMAHLAGYTWNLNLL